MLNKRKSTNPVVGVLVVVLLICNLASLSIIFGRVSSYTEAKFVNIMPLTEDGASDTGSVVTIVGDASSDSVRDEVGHLPNGTTSYTSGAEGFRMNPEFHMEAEVAIFKLSYDETGKITVIGPDGNEDNLIAPGTSNLYKFTLANTGDVALDYNLTMEAYFSGTGDLWIPVNARVYDYSNEYFVGSEQDMVDVLELNTVDINKELGAGRYAVYNLEWEWPFERPDEFGSIATNDQYDTMLGDLAVDQDLVLTIVIRTVAEYDEDPEDPDTGIKPPQTGDDSQLLLFSLLCIGSFVGICAMAFAYVKTNKKEKTAKQ